MRGTDHETFKPQIIGKTKAIAAFRIAPSVELETESYINQCILKDFG